MIDPDQARKARERQQEVASLRSARSGSAHALADPGHHLVFDSIREIQDWVGDDPDRARIALEAEEARARPRKTLIPWLEGVIDG